jgi:hypothetical protein
MALSIEELVQRTPTIVHGVVVRTETNWDDRHASIWTWTEVLVKQPIKGSVGRTVLVKQPGGVVGEVSQFVSGAAAFEPSEEVVLFLEPAVDEKNAYVLMGLSVGKVLLEEQRLIKVARRSLKGLSFARAGRRGMAEPLPEMEQLGTAEAFLNRVRQAVRGEHR